MTRQKETEDRDEVLKKLGKHGVAAGNAIGIAGASVENISLMPSRAFGFPRESGAERAGARPPHAQTAKL